VVWSSALELQKEGHFSSALLSVPTAMDKRAGARVVQENPQPLPLVIPRPEVERLALT
jgi:hypothetical protein